MAVSTTVSEISYRPGAAMAPEGLTGIVYTSTAEIAVYRRESDDGAWTPAYLDEDYQLGGDGSTGSGWIRALHAEASGVSFLVRRETDLKQLLQFPPNQPLSAPSIEAGLDKAMRALQDMTRDAGRALLFPIGESVPVFPRYQDRVSTTLGFGPDGAIVIRNPQAEVLFLRPAIYQLLGSDLNGAPVLIRLGAKGDGLNDDRDAFVQADALGSFTVPPGAFRIGSDLTLTADVTFEAGAVLVIPNGVTVTFTGNVDAPRKRIFSLLGDGAVSGLYNTSLEWFVGHIKGNLIYPPTIECRALIQAAFHATPDGGMVTSGPGWWLIDGAAYIDVGGASFQGYNRDATGFLWAGSSTYGFRARDTGLGYRGGSLRGFTFKPKTKGTIPTDGWAIYVNQSDFAVDDFMIFDPYNGINWDTLTAGSCSHFQIIGALKAGFKALNGISDLKVRDFVIQSLYEWVTLSGVTGAFNVGDDLTLNGGASGGSVVDAYGSNRYRMMFYSTKPAIGNTLTSSSGGSATISSVTVGHQVAGLRWEVTDGVSYQEAMSFEDGDVLGGEYSFTAHGMGAVGRGGNPAYNHVSQSMYFDTTWSGALLDGIYGTSLNAWFATSRTTDAFGVALVNCKKVRGSPHLVNNAGAGIQWDNTCGDIEFLSIDCEGNNVKYSSGAASTMGDIRVLGGGGNWSLIGGRAGFQGANGVTPVHSICIADGAGDSIKVIGLNVAGASVYNGASGASQWWIGVEGIPDRVNGHLLGYSDLSNVPGIHSIALSFEGSAFTGLQHNNLLSINPSPSATDVANRRFMRRASYTGGTDGFVNVAVMIDTEVGSEVTNYEWNVLEKLTNNASTGENTAGYSQAIKTGTGWTAARVFELIEQGGGDPTKGSVGTETDLRANGTDSHNNRIGQDVVISRPRVAGAYSGPAMVATYGHRVGHGGDTQAAVTVAYDTTQANVQQAALRLKSGQSIAFDENAQHQLSYDGAGLAYKVNGKLVARFNANGTVDRKALLVSQLPPAGSVGREAIVIDATTLTKGAAAVGGGSEKTMVRDDGGSWRIA